MTAQEEPQPVVVNALPDQPIIRLPLLKYVSLVKGLRNAQAKGCLEFNLLRCAALPCQKARAFPCQNQVGGTIQVLA